MLAEKRRVGEDDNELVLRGVFCFVVMYLVLKVSMSNSKQRRLFNFRHTCNSAELAAVEETTGGTFLPNVAPTHLTHLAQLGRDCIWFITILQALLTHVKAAQATPRGRNECMRLSIIRCDIADSRDSDGQGMSLHAKACSPSSPCTTRQDVYFRYHRTAVRDRRIFRCRVSILLSATEPQSRT